MYSLNGSHACIQLLNTDLFQYFGSKVIEVVSRLSSLKGNAVVFSYDRYKIYLFVDCSKNIADEYRFLYTTNNNAHYNNATALL